MQLKTYQQQALDQLDRWLAALKKARLDSERVTTALEDTGVDILEDLKNHPRSAWNSLKRQNALPGIQNQDGNNEVPGYVSRTATSGEPVPHVCLKVPTGGGQNASGRRCA